MPPSRFVRALLLLSLLSLTGGCALLEQEPDADPEPTRDPQATDEPPEAARSDEERASPPTLAGILNRLQAGEWDRAEAMLEQFRESRPEDPTARSLQRQLKEDPETLLADGETRHTVEAGDTLGLIARRYTGDATQFVILARLNDIRRPKHLTVGQQLRVPPSADPQDGGEPGVTPDLDEQLQALDAGAEDGSGERGESYRMTIRADLDAGRHEAAYETARAAREAAPGEAWDDWLDPLEREAAAAHYERRGLDARDRGDADAARDWLERALEAEPGREPARTELARLRRAEAETLHSAAIVHYRNQELERAIELWDAALELDPDFDAAEGYRLRARELQRRLENME
ncbi:LysM peptidoglycan-binding domain-containing protein [Thioalkalivibrio sp. ALgr3]|uniref:LysM peptidoglycan-binding domain-containing protein n=1 Tax=Thioalkalivibrio sp. ALgr3 TaxID=1239292 RepID=UPI000380E653|nr:LysM peptidoglycan-binding domain-containing protein [Thioalkalivibrio sp. ALgr3]